MFINAFETNNNLLHNHFSLFLDVDEIEEEETISLNTMNLKGNLKECTLKCVTNDFKEMPKGWRDQVGYTEKMLTLVDADFGKTYTGANRENFTVEEVIHAIEDFERERRTRPEARRGIDPDHCFLEMMQEVGSCDDGTKIYTMWFGS
jgi:hypothetical protein